MPASPAQQPSHEDTEQRIDVLLRQMTIEEKAGQLTQFVKHDAPTLDLIRQGKVGSLLGVLGVNDTNEAQRAALQSRLKVPLIFGYDVIHGYRTIFPVPLRAHPASTDAHEQVEQVAAKETMYPVLWLSHPWSISLATHAGVNRRGAEKILTWVHGCSRQSPWLPGQQNKPILTEVVCAKHYVAYGAVEGGRDYNTGGYFRAAPPRSLPAPVSCRR